MRRSGDREALFIVPIVLLVLIGAVVVLGVHLWQYVPPSFPLRDPKYWQTMGVVFLGAFLGARMSQ